MNIREIEIFRAVMQEGSITRAANNLHISQPAASKYVAQLERRMGLALFRRDGNRLIPTPEGRALFVQVDRLFLGLSQVERFMKDISDMRRGHVSVACLPMLSLTVMPDVIAAFTRDKPDVSISLQTRSSLQIGESVASKQLDFGIGMHWPGHVGVTFEHLVDLELFCVLPPGDPLESRAEIQLEDLAGRDIISLSNYDQSQAELEVLLMQNKIAPRRRIEVFWMSVALALALRGVGIALVDRLTATSVPGALEHLRVFRPRLSIELSIFWPEHWESSLIARALAAAICRETLLRSQTV